ncbi:MAG: AAA family ATPase [Candidatus Caldarchaeum sp.]
MAVGLKQFYDLYPNLKFILSGSSRLLLSREAVQMLAGRFFTLKLKPLTFMEFLEIKTGGRTALPQRAFISFFNEYLVKAGFPEIVNWENEEKVAEYVKNSVVERVVYRDIPSIFKTRNLELMNNLVKQFVLTPGLTVNVNHLSRTLGETRIMVSNYLKHLETTMVVRALANYRPSTASSSRKLKKYYPATSALTFAYSKRDFYEKMGAVLETYVVNALDAQYYFNQGRREVDVVLTYDGLTLVEVKQSVDSGDVAKIAELAKLLKAGKAFIISHDQELVENNVQVVPAYSLENTPIRKRVDE